MNAGFQGIKTGVVAAFLLTCGASLGACSDPDPDAVLIELAPEVVSSNDGTLHVRALVAGERAPLSGQAVTVAVAYTDRNGMDHAVDGSTGTTDDNGRFEAVLTGLDWEGTGTVTVQAVDGAGAALMNGDAAVQGVATFAVLDRTPPTVKIISPTTDNRVGPGLPIEVEVEVSDEIGVSEVFLEASGDLDKLRSTVVASGATSATVRFEFDIPDNARPGPTITLYALAGDLSNNQAAAEPLVLTVDPAINVATPAGLSGAQITEGDNNFLDDPRALAVSPKDGMIYVADNSGSACGGACIRQVDPATGTVSSAIVVTGNGTLEGVSFDATGDNMYYTDRQDRLMRMTYSAANSRYEGAVACNDPNNQVPADPYHAVFDAALGLLVTDQDRGRVYQQAACTGNDPVSFTGGAFDKPWGIALGAPGVAYVSDEGTDEIYAVDTSNGDVTLFEWRNLDKPRGIEWLAGGTSDYADSLLIANTDRNTVSSTTGGGAIRPVVYLRNRPVDVALVSGTLYVLTRPSAGDRGRIFTVTGF